MKQLIALTLLCVVLTFAACGGEENSGESSSGLSQRSSQTDSSSVPAAEQLLQGVGETRLESRWFSLSLDLPEGWRFLSSGELDTASSLAESQMEQKEIAGERQDSEALTQLTLMNDSLAASLQFQCIPWEDGDSAQAADVLRESLLEYFPDLSEPEAVTLAHSTWLRMAERTSSRLSPTFCMISKRAWSS